MLFKYIHRDLCLVCLQNVWFSCISYVLLTMPYLLKFLSQTFWYHIGWFLPDSYKSSHRTLSSIIQNVHVTQFSDLGHSIFSLIICYYYKDACKYLSLIQTALLCSQPKPLSLFELLVNVYQLYLIHLPLSSRPSSHI